MHLSQFANFLRNATSSKQAEAILREYLLQWGIHHYAVTYYSGHIKTGRKLRYDHVASGLRTWHQHYLEQNYADVDRTLEEYYLQNLPLFWSVPEQLRQAKNKREKRLRQESLQYGIDCGLSIPVHGPHHDFLSLTLHQFRQESSLQDYHEQQYLWLAAAQIYYATIKRILQLQKAPPLYQLTRREKQCLTFTAKSWRVEKIAQELKISPRTVNFHIQNANKKMGTNNKYQAVNKYFNEEDEGE